MAGPLIKAAAPVRVPPDAHVVLGASLGLRLRFVDDVRKPDRQCTRDDQEPAAPHRISLPDRWEAYPVRGRQVEEAERAKVDADALAADTRPHQGAVGAERAEAADLNPAGVTGMAGAGPPEADPPGGG